MALGTPPKFAAHRRGEGGSPGRKPAGKRRLGSLASRSVPSMSRSDIFCFFVYVWGGHLPEGVNTDANTRWWPWLLVCRSTRLRVQSHIRLRL